MPLAQQLGDIRLFSACTLGTQVRTSSGSCSDCRSSAQPRLPPPSSMFTRL